MFIIMAAFAKSGTRTLKQHVLNAFWVKVSVPPVSCFLILLFHCIHLVRVMHQC